MTPTPHLRSAPAATALFIAAFALSGCVEPEAKTCSTGIYCPAGSRCAARQAACIFDDCADGVVQAGEVCDDGNKIDGDGCSADCKSNETCGNTVVDVTMGEVCDDGNNADSDGCSADCRSVEGCGNGSVDPREDCDAGPSGVPNVAEETPACDSNCTWARHGDGVVNATAEEQCDGDNGRNCESSACNYDCTLSTCGDGVKNALAGEACDEGLNNSDTGDCLLSCQANACGDTHVNQAPDQFGNPKEECDEGSANNSDTGACLRNCRRAECGDTHEWAGVEACDDGAGSATVKTECDYGQRTCTLCSACQWAQLTGPYCGDGRPHAKEVCDDGAADNGATSCDYGTPSCSICNGDCSESLPRSGPVCGDRRPDYAFGEACDDGNTDTENECPYGELSCIACSGDCRTTLSNLRTSYCGDNRVDPRYERGDNACDDAASFGCRTCDAVTCTRVDLAPASGTISVTSAAFGDGDTFALEDGVNAPVTFELNTEGGCQPTGTVCVDLIGATVDNAAPRIQRAINDVDSALRITAAPDGGTTQLRLTNDSNGIAGNNPIVTNNSSIVVAPATGAIVVQGMTGGTGCASGAPCRYNSDCLLPVCKNNNTCF